MEYKFVLQFSLINTRLFLRLKLFMRICVVWIIYWQARCLFDRIVENSLRIIFLLLKCLLQTNWFKSCLNISIYNLKSKHMISKTICLCLFLFIVVLGLPSYSRNLRETDSLRPTGGNNTLVQILTDIPFQYSLPGTNQKWLQYVQLATSFTLQFSQYVIINIKISLFLNQACRMKFRVMIDGVEHRIFRYQTGETKYVVYFMTEPVWMQKSKHNIQVEYFKTGGQQFIVTGRSNMAMLQLEYMQPIQNKQDYSKINVLQLMKNKTITVQPTYPFSLITDNVWHPFPNFQLMFTLQVPQNVYINYKTSVYFKEFNTASHFLIRVFIDQKQYEPLRTISGFSSWNTNQSGQFVFLQAGRHHLRAQYRTPGGMNPINLYDWISNFLRVKY